MGTRTVGRGGDGDTTCGDGWGWGQVLVPVQPSIRHLLPPVRHSSVVLGYGPPCFLSLPNLTYKKYQSLMTYGLRENRPLSLIPETRVQFKPCSVFGPVDVFIY